MQSLSAGYETTFDLLEAGKRAEAAAAYRKGCLLTVKRLYSEAADTYPVRFAKIDNWCAWSKELYVLSVKADKAFQHAAADPPGKASAAPSDGEGRKLLSALREHVHKLHEKTATQKANDYIYAFRREAMRDKPDARTLKTLRDALDEAPLSAKAKKNAGDYGKAKDAWAQGIDAILADGAVAPAEIGALRKSTDTFYRAYGVQFE